MVEFNQGFVHSGMQRRSKKFEFEENFQFIVICVAIY